MKSAARKVKEEEWRKQTVCSSGPSCPYGRWLKDTTQYKDRVWLTVFQFYIYGGIWREEATFVHFLQIDNLSINIKPILFPSHEHWHFIVCFGILTAIFYPFLLWWFRYLGITCIYCSLPFVKAFVFINGLQFYWFSISEFIIAWILTMNSLYSIIWQAKKYMHLIN